MIQLRDTTGTLRTVAKVMIRDTTNALREVSTIRLRDAANALRTVQIGSDTGDFSLTVSPLSAIGSVSAPYPAGGYTNAVTANASGGAAPYTYAWTASSGWTPSDPTLATTYFNSPDADPSSVVTGTATVIVTDANGGTATSPTVPLRIRNNYISLD